MVTSGIAHEVELTEVGDTKHDTGTKLRIGVAAVGITQKRVLKVLKLSLHKCAHTLHTLILHVGLVTVE